MRSVTRQDPPEASNAGAQAQLGDVSIPSKGVLDDPSTLTITGEDPAAIFLDHHQDSPEASNSGAQAQLDDVSIPSKGVLDDPSSLTITGEDPAAIQLIKVFTRRQVYTTVLHSNLSRIDTHAISMHTPVRLRRLNGRINSARTFWQRPCVEESWPVCIDQSRELTRFFRILHASILSKENRLFSRP